MKNIHLLVATVSVALLTSSMNTLAGGKSRDAYFVKVDSETTTQNNPSSSGTASGKRQHKPLTVTRSIDKASPMIVTTVGIHKVSDVTLKRGLVD